MTQLIAAIRKNPQQSMLAAGAVTVTVALIGALAFGIVGRNKDATTVD